MRRLPWWALPLGLPATAGDGWALPWFGVPLLGFLAVDALLGLAARRRRPAAPVR